MLCATFFSTAGLFCLSAFVCLLSLKFLLFRVQVSLVPSYDYVFCTMPPGCDQIFFPFLYSRISQFSFSLFDQPNVYINGELLVDPSVFGLWRDPLMLLGILVLLLPVSRGRSPWLFPVYTSSENQGPLSPVESLGCVVFFCVFTIVTIAFS